MAQQEGPGRSELVEALRQARHRWERGRADGDRPGDDEPAGDGSAMDAGSGVEDSIEELSELVRALDKIGDRPLVGRVADRLVQVAADIDRDWEEDATELNLGSVVTVLAEVGQVDRAEQIASAIPDQRVKGALQGELAQELLAAGDFGRAEQIVDAIEDAELRSAALIDVMRSLIEAGDPGEIRRVAQRAQECIATIADVDVKVSRLAQLVRALISGGYPTEARQIADQIEKIAFSVTDPDVRDSARASAVQALVFVGEFDRAEQLIPGIGDQFARQSATFGLAKSLGAAGDFDRGLRLAAGIATAESRSSAQEQLAKSMAMSGDFARAESTASAIESLSAQSRALGVLTGAMAAAGDRAGSQRVARRAERILSEIDHPVMRTLVRQDVVEALIDAGAVEEAERIAFAGSEARDWTGDRDRLPRALADAGDLAGARRVIDRATPFALAMTDPDSRARTLNWLVDDLIAVGAADDAVRLLVEATGVGAWYLTLSTVAALEPEAVRVLADDVLSEEVPSRA